MQEFKIGSCNHTKLMVDKIFILPDIRDGVIIESNSVVGSDIEPYTIVVGNPARQIRKRFNNELIEIMEKLK